MLSDTLDLIVSSNHPNEARVGRVPGHTPLLRWRGRSTTAVGAHVGERLRPKADQVDLAQPAVVALKNLGSRVILFVDPGVAVLVAKGREAKLDRGALAV
jgi:hypothetical protein